MARDGITSAVRAGFVGDIFCGIPFVHLDLVGDPVRVWGGNGSIDAMGETFEGMGTLGEISNFKSGVGGGVGSIELSLAGFDASVLADAKSANYRGRRGSVWLGVFDENWQLIGDPVLFARGEISTMVLQRRTKEVGRISVTIQGRVGLLKKNKPRFRTSEDQKRNSATDDIYTGVANVRQKTVYWGASAVRGSGRGSSGGYHEDHGNGRSFVNGIV